MPGALETAEQAPKKTQLILNTYQNTGIYTVSLTVSGTGGSDNETKTDYITVTASGEAPDVDFFASPKSGDAPLTVQFTDFSTGEINSWSWSFGDNGTSEEQNPTHVYERPGAFPVSLTVSGPGGSNTRTKTGYITVCSQTPWHFNDEPHDEWPWWWF
jgi:PKD repeat protein